MIELQHGPDRRQGVEGLVTAEEVVRVKIPASDQDSLMGLNDRQFGNPKPIVAAQDGSVWIAPDTAMR